MQSARNDLYENNPLAALFMDHLLFELVVMPNLDNITPSLTREQILDKLWEMIKDKELTIFYEEDEDAFWADYDIDKILQKLS